MSWMGRVDNERIGEFSKLLGRCMDRYPNESVGKIICNAYHSYIRYATKRAGVPMEITGTDFIKTITDDVLKRALIHYSNLPVEEES